MGQIQLLGLDNDRNLDIAEGLPCEWIELLIHIAGDLLDVSIEYLCLIEAMQVKYITL